MLNFVHHKVREDVLYIYGLVQCQITSFDKIRVALKIHTFSWSL